MEEEKKNSENRMEDSAENEIAQKSQEKWEDSARKLEEEIASLKDTLLRCIAESENLRRRLEKEKEEAIRYANSKFARDLLAVVDNFERVTANVTSSASIREKIEADTGLKALFDGILLCEKELLFAFKKNGISPIELKEGDAFNPAYHQAMCELDSPDGKAGVVMTVMQAGYIYQDRLLRPALVSVSKKA
ncbi:MAG: nucleotide exchange factor GrpE [Holosporaceae bacterium]|jgi:molecular chaperone GrpE|nr:nucleotide exchange factor GrpE [Holosporaceae bacterium]